MPASAENVGLLERRIIELLTTTNLTFREIILKLDGENLSASIGIIRRINRDNRYRRPRYDSKLTPAQRESLVEELRDHQGVKPNLSLLAKRYGVCHGSVWYWWDKLNRIKRSDPHTRDSFKNKSLFRRSYQMQLLSASARTNLINADDVVFKRRPPTNSSSSSSSISSISSSSSRSSSSGSSRSNNNNKNNNNMLLDTRFNLVGRVSIVTRETMGLLELPVLMFTTNTSENDWPLKLIESRNADLLAGSQLGLGKMSFELNESSILVIKTDV